MVAMNIQQFIERAIEGGYEPFKTVKMSELICEVHGLHYGCNFKPKNGAQVKGIAGRHVYEILLDPLAWQSVGKVEGWNKKDRKLSHYSNGPKMGMMQGHSYSLGGWRHNWHRMIDALADGETLEEFLANIASPE